MDPREAGNKGSGLRRKKIAGLIVIGMLAVILSGCQTLTFYKQAIQGQYQIFSRERPIQKVLADTNTSPALKQRLEFVLQLRQFADTQLKLPVDKQYTKYADLGRRYVVWDVYAAPEFSLEAKKWWYPFVGSLDYRGYFSEKAARSYASKLGQHNYDVYVGGVEAYSTLGWFKDPILNTFIFNRDLDLAETLFHELAHQKVFVGGDTDFNEAFATTVGEEGVRRWLRAHNDAAGRDQYLVDVEHDEQFVALILSTRRKLAALYKTEPKPEDRKTPASVKAADREKKAAIIDQLRQNYQDLRARWGGYSGYDKWFKGPLNNAQLNTISTYYKLVPVFQKMLSANGGDLEKFYQQADKLAHFSKKERKKRLEELAK